MKSFWITVKGLGFSVPGTVGFRVSSLEFRVQGIELRV